MRRAGDGWSKANLTEIFNFAPEKKEGGFVVYDSIITPDAPTINCSYIERRVPTKYKELFEELIDAELIKLGYDPLVF